jgi:Lrp/AsnC family transcriptional regulator for asnA, asnC and gidA
LSHLKRKDWSTKEIDAKILRNLLEDGRKEFGSIAKQCGASKRVIWNHYRELKKAGVIVGSTVHMNYACFGFNAVGNIQVTVELAKVDKVNDEIRRIPNIYGAYRIGKSSGIMVIVTLKTLDELDRVKEAIKRIPGVVKLTTQIWTGIKNIPENLEILPQVQGSGEAIESGAATSNSSGRTACKIDEIDMKIIEKLANDGRMSFRKIAKELKISTDTVARRYRELRRNNVIKVLIQIDPTKIGFRGIAIFMITFAYEKTVSSVVATIAKIPNVTLIIKTSGNYDLSAFVMIKDIEQLMSVQDEITSIPGITYVQSAIMKSYSPWPGPKEYISTF